MDLIGRTKFVSSVMLFNTHLRTRETLPTDLTFTFEHNIFLSVYLSCSLEPVLSAEKNDGLKALVQVKRKVRHQGIKPVSKRDFCRPVDTELLNYSLNLNPIH